MNKISYLEKGKKLLEEEDGVSRLRAFQCFKKALRRGEIGAEYWMGRCKRLGLGTKASDEKAREYFLAGAEKDDGACMYELYDMNVRESSKIGEDEAANWLQRAAKKNLPRALFAHGMRLLCDDDDANAATKGIVEIAKAAANGDENAMEKMKRLEDTLRLDGREGSEGRKLSEGEIAALALGECLLGAGCELGWTADEYAEDAPKWYERAEAKGSPAGRVLSDMWEILRDGRDEADRLGSRMATMEADRDAGRAFDEDEYKIAERFRRNISELVDEAEDQFVTVASLMDFGGDWEKELIRYETICTEIEDACFWLNKPREKNISTDEKKRNDEK